MFPSLLRFIIGISFFSWMMAVYTPAFAGEEDSAGIQFFETRIRPVLVKYCYECHSAKAAKIRAGLLVDQRDDFRKGGDTGPAFLPGKVEGSLLLEALRHEGMKMPPREKLSAAIIADFETWIRMGAPDPRVTKQAARVDHWSLKPRTRPTPPRFDDPPWAARCQNPIDAFILEKLTAQGLKPAGPSDRAVLLRRLTFDLIGLPPTPEDLTRFLEDSSADAYEKQVDRLLASPHYGERWGRHWLDVVRYAESEGFEYDSFRPGAWRYRDYVIQSLNQDKPFDQFLLEQIAGDELDPDNHDYLAAAGFHRLGPVRRNAGNKLVSFSRNEVLTERTDAIGYAFLGLTLGCARCHDHRFDPIPQKDYYRLQAFLASAQDHDRVLADEDTQKKWQARSEEIKTEIKKLQQELQGKEGSIREKIQMRIFSLRREQNTSLPTISTVLNDASLRTPIHLLIRGETEKKSFQVGPRFLSALIPDSVPEASPDLDKPRTQLAAWLNDPDHPLVARVLVNRIWHYHFGQGLAATPNDLGVNGARPSHPELLDWLANEFILGGRKLKPLHRMIVLSSTYRQAVEPTDPARSRKVDPENRLLSHFPRRRLSAEELRDAMLAISGKLNEKAGGPSVLVPVEADLVQLLYDPFQWTVTPDQREHHRRSIYLAVKRNLQLPFAQVFDQPDGQISCARRESSTHALQSLELLNGKLSNQLAEGFAERLIREVGSGREQQVDRAFSLALGRLPTSRERELALDFLRTGSLREFCLAIFNLNGFLYVN